MSRSEVKRYRLLSYNKIILQYEFFPTKQNNSSLISLPSDFGLCKKVASSTQALFGMIDFRKCLRWCSLQYNTVPTRLAKDIIVRYLNPVYSYTSSKRLTLILSSQKPGCLKFSSLDVSRLYSCPLFLIHATCLSHIP
jgi:hypothetical protein